MANVFLRDSSSISPNALFSFNGRRLVTSLILVITTIILLILLLVNLNCNILTEATVNTSINSPTQPIQPTSLLPFLNINPSSTPTSSSSSSNNSALTVTLSSSPSSSSSSASARQLTTTNQDDSANRADNSNNNSYHHHSLSNARQPKNSDPFPDSPAINNNHNKNNIIIDNNKTTTEQSITMAPSSSTNNNKDSDKISSISPSQPSSTTTTTTTTTSSSNDTSSSSTSANPTLSPLDESNSGQQNSPCVTTESERSLKTNLTENIKLFDIEYAKNSFQDSMADRNAISLNHYINGFKELMKFFHSLGTIFLFVTSDLENKIGLLENYRNIEKGGCNPAYSTIQSTIEYERNENLLRDSKRQSGARTILRLHRALEFLSSLMRNLSKLEDDQETAPAAREAYSDTLAKHHPWTIRTIASFAMRTLPHKRALVESVLGRDALGNATETNEKMLALANVTDNLFNVVDKYYDENNIKDLP